MLQTRNLIKKFGGLAATDGVNLQVTAGELHAVIGPNGAGKTTLVAQISGELTPDSGTIQFAGQDVTRLPVYRRSRMGLARSFQITSIFSELTTLASVSLAVQAHAGHSFRFWSPTQDDETLTGPARSCLAKVGIDDRADVHAGHLSHGERRALEIAMALATQPRLLLLDEPLAGMGPDEAARMINLLQILKASFTILLIEHDMEAVFALADRITVLVGGRVVALGTPAEIQNNEEVRRAYLGEGEISDDH